MKKDNNMGGFSASLVGPKDRSTSYNRLDTY